MTGPKASMHLFILIYFNLAWITWPSSTPVTLICRWAMKIKLVKNLNSVQFIIVQVLYFLITHKKSQHDPDLYFLIPFKFHEVANARLQKKLLKARTIYFYKHTKECFFNQVKTKYLPTLIQWMIEQNLLKLKWRGGEDKENKW